MVEPRTPQTNIRGHGAQSMQALYGQRSDRSDSNHSQYQTERHRNASPKMDSIPELDNNTKKAIFGLLNLKPGKTGAQNDQISLIQKSL